MTECKSSGGESEVWLGREVGQGGREESGGVSSTLAGTLRQGRQEDGGDEVPGRALMVTLG